MDLINIGYQFKNTAHENSTKEAKDAFEALKRLIHIPGKIRNIDIATAYTDTKALLGLIKLCKDSKWADKRTEPTIRIFLDWQSTVKLKAELKSLVQCPEKTDKSAKKLLLYLERKGKELIRKLSCMQLKLESSFTRRQYLLKPTLIHGHA